MKAKLLTVAVVLAFVFLGVTPNQAAQKDEVAVAADALLVRPLCFVATIVGGAVFVVALPVAAPSGSIDSTAETLVKRPAWATFKRPLGDFGFALEYTAKDSGKTKHKAIARGSKAGHKSAKQ
ncbi:MAG TPA: hypothetical protein VJA21_05815 [Verrucomicrobiae bacterium]